MYDSATLQIAVHHRGLLGFPNTTHVNTSSPRGFHRKPKFTNNTIPALYQHLGAPSHSDPYLCGGAVQNTRCADRYKGLVAGKIEFAHAIHPVRCGIASLAVRKLLNTRRVHQSLAAQMNNRVSFHPALPGGATFHDGVSITSPGFYRLLLWLL